ncbi:hypothetical protein LA080_014174 [Diaporthe eres]|nr:hypothetical protein LA080_014174 [Diaporthe eres]
MANAHQNPGNSSEEEKESSIEAKEQLAYELDRNEDTEGAITTYKEIIEMKTREYGEDSLQVAKTLQELGETYVEKGRLDEAQEVLQRVLGIRAASATLPGNDEDQAEYDKRRDAAITRDILGRVYEQRGDIETARAPSQCDDDGELLNRETYKTCSRCRAVFYCCRDCQVNDWGLSHKESCQIHSAAQTLVKVSTTEASSSKASPAAVPSTEPTSDSGSAQNQVLPADKEGTSEDREGTSEDKEGTSADVSGPVAPPTSKKQRKNKKRNVRRRAKKKSGENNQSGPSQSQAGPPDGPSRSEDAERVEEKKGSQPLSNDTSHTPEAVEPVEPAIEPVEPPVEPVEPPVEPVEPPVEPVEPA